MTRVAVITDSLSTEFFFPLWHRYYSSEFGAENLHVLTHKIDLESFKSWDLGSVVGIAETYDDNDRLLAVTSRVEELLREYDIVIRVDTDEFLIPDPRKFASLRDFAQSFSGEFACARGFDVFEHRDDSSLDPSRPIIGGQRKYAFANSAMNKPFITKKLVGWNRGFHCVKEAPRLVDVFLFHLKRIDINWQVQWNEHVAKRIVSDDFIKGYYETPRSRLEEFHSGLSDRQVLSGEDVLYREDFLNRWKETIVVDNEGFHVGSYIIDDVTVEIPQQFWSRI